MLGVVQEVTGLPNDPEELTPPLGWSAYGESLDTSID